MEKKYNTDYQWQSNRPHKTFYNENDTLNLFYMPNAVFYTTSKVRMSFWQAYTQLHLQQCSLFVLYQFYGTFIFGNVSKHFIGEPPTNTYYSRSAPYHLAHGCCHCCVTLDNYTLLRSFEYLQVRLLVVSHCIFSWNIRDLCSLKRLRYDKRECRWIKNMCDRDLKSSQTGAPNKMAVLMAKRS